MDEHIEMNDEIVINFNRKLLINTVEKMVEGIDKQPEYFKKDLMVIHQHLLNIKKQIETAKFGFETYWQNLLQTIKLYPEDLREYVLMDVQQYFEQL